MNRRSMVLVAAVVAGTGLLATLAVWFFGSPDKVACGDRVIEQKPVKTTAKAEFERARNLAQGGDVKAAIPLYKQAVQNGSAEAAVALSNYYEDEMRRLRTENGQNMNTEAYKKSYEMSLFWADQARKLGIDLFNCGGGR